MTMNRQSQDHVDGFIRNLQTAVERAETTRGLWELRSETNISFDVFDDSKVEDSCGVIEYTYHRDVNTGAVGWMRRVVEADEIPASDTRRRP